MLNKKITFICSASKHPEMLRVCLIVQSSTTEVAFMTNSKINFGTPE